MADTQFQLRPQVNEEGGRLWVWVGAAIVVVVALIAAVMRVA